MKRWMIAALTLTILTPALADEATPAQAAASTPPKARIVVKVTPLKSAEGNLLCALFGGAGGFPDDPRAAKGLASVRIKADGKPLYATCVFEDVPPGSYAVSVIHDENTNGKLDTNFFGVPSEGYGFSRDARGSMGPPAFDAAKFGVKGGTLELKLRPEY